MGSATKPSSAWSKETKADWSDDIIELAEIVSISADDVEALDDDLDADLVKVTNQAATVNRSKLSLVLREYGRAYCDEHADGYKGSGKAQTAFAVEMMDDIIGVCEGGKRKPVTAALVGFAEAFGKRFAK